MSPHLQQHMLAIPSGSPTGSQRSKRFRGFLRQQQTKAPQACPRAGSPLYIAVTEMPGMDDEAVKGADDPCASIQAARWDALPSDSDSTPPATTANPARKPGAPEEEWPASYARRVLDLDALDCDEEGPDDIGIAPAYTAARICRSNALAPRSAVSTAGTPIPRSAALTPSRAVTQTTPPTPPAVAASRCSAMAEAAVSYSEEGACSSAVPEAVPAAVAATSPPRVVAADTVVSPALARARAASLARDCLTQHSQRVGRGAPACSTPSAQSVGEASRSQGMAARARLIRRSQPQPQPLPRSLPQPLPLQDTAELQSTVELQPAKVAHVVKWEAAVAQRQWAADSAGCDVGTPGSGSGSGATLNTASAVAQARAASTALAARAKEDMAAKRAAAVKRQSSEETALLDQIYSAMIVYEEELGKDSNGTKTSLVLRLGCGPPRPPTLALMDDSDEGSIGVGSASPRGGRQGGREPCGAGADSVAARGALESPNRVAADLRGEAVRGASHWSEVRKLLREDVEAERARLKLAADVEARARAEAEARAAVETRLAADASRALQEARLVVEVEARARAEAEAKVAGLTRSVVQAEAKPTAAAARAKENVARPNAEQPAQGVCLRGSTMPARIAETERAAARAEEEARAVEKWRMAATARVEASEAAMKTRKQLAAQQAAERARAEAAAEAATEAARLAADATAMGWAAIVEQRQWLGKAEVQASNLLTEAETDSAPSSKLASPRVQPPAGSVVANVTPSKSMRRKSSPTRKRATTREALAAADAAQKKGAATRAAASSVRIPGTPPPPLSTPCTPMTHAVFKV